MKRFVLCIVLCIVSFYSFAQSKDPWDELLVPSLYGRVRMLNYASHYDVVNLIKYVDTKEEADIWVAIFNPKNPESVAKYNQIKDKRCVWLIYDGNEFPDVNCPTIAVYNCMYKEEVAHFYRIIKVKIVPYGEQGINKAKPNNALLYTEYNRDPYVSEYLEAALY